MSTPDAGGAGEDLEAFAAGRAGCYRMVRDDVGGRPAHCPKPPAWAGTYRDGRGRRHQVRACEDHRSGLERARRLDAC